MTAPKTRTAIGYMTTEATPDGFEVNIKFDSLHFKDLEIKEVSARIDTATRKATETFARLKKEGDDLFLFRESTRLYKEDDGSAS